MNAILSLRVQDRTVFRRASRQDLEAIDDDVRFATGNAVTRSRPEPPSAAFPAAGFPARPRSL